MQVPIRQGTAENPNLAERVVWDMAKQTNCRHYYATLKHVALCTPAYICMLGRQILQSLQAQSDQLIKNVQKPKRLRRARLQRLQSSS